MEKWVLITIISSISVFVLGIALGVFLYLRYLRKKIVHDYALEPESFLEKKKIPMTKKIAYNQWGFKTGNDCKVVKEKDLLGQYFKATFDQKEGQIRSIVSNHHLSFSLTKLNCYFEVEIVDKAAKDTNIVIGFTNSDSIFTNLPGNMSSSVGFHSLTGTLKYNLSLTKEFNFYASFGETIGIGIRCSDGRIWCSYNGKFLNEPPPSEFKALEDKTKKKKKKEEINGDFEMEGNAKEEAKLENELKPKIITTKFNDKENIFAVIATTGPCEILINVGGAAFKLYQKEIAEGLI